jgi:arylsulfatase A-like enzyme
MITAVKSKNLVVLSFLFSITTFFQSYSQQVKKPNVIIVLSDDQGYGDFSGHGNPILKTPALDKLANESISLTDFHVAPLCTPSRGQLMTGLDAYHNKASTVGSASGIVRRDVIMMPESFKKNGYTTGIFGKWHLGESYPDRPMDNGFDKSIWVKGWGLLSEMEYDNDYYETRYLDSLTTKYSNKYCSNLWFDKAMEWMDESAKSDKPFFTYIALNAPHGPFDSPKQDYDFYKDKVTNEKTASFFGMIKNIDRNMSRLENWMEAKGLKENTILIYMTDNGTAQGEDVFNADMRGKKTSLYEGGHRVTCFIRWPKGNLVGPINIDTPTQVQDILPTLIELGNFKKEQQSFDGVSMAPLLYPESKFEDRMFVVQYGAIPATKYESCLVFGNWRLIGKDELYNIKTDPSQTNNVANSHPKIVKEMKIYYENWWSKLESEKKQLVPLIVGSDQENPVTLNSSNWLNNLVNTQWKVAIGGGLKNGGESYIYIEQAGTYRIELNRWPFHLNKKLNSKGPEFSIGGKSINQGKALDIAYGCMSIGNEEIKIQKIDQNSSYISFQIELEKGETKFRGWFMDDNKNNICGAYYTRFTKI